MSENLTNATRARRRTATTQNSDGEDQPRGNEETKLDEVSAVSVENVTALTEDKPDATPQPPASPAYSTLYSHGQGTQASTPHAKSAPRMTMANIRDMMEQNVQDINKKPGRKTRRRYVSTTAGS